MSQHRFNQLRLFFPLVFRFFDSSRFPHTFAASTARAPCADSCLLAFLRRWLACVRCHRHVPRLTRLMSIYANELLDGKCRVGGGIEFARLRTLIKQPPVTGWQRATICSFAGFNLCNRALDNTSRHFSLNLIKEITQSRVGEPKNGKSLFVLINR